MNLRRRFRLWLLVLVELSFAAVAVATEQFWLLLIAGPVAALSWYMVEGPRGRPLPRWAVNIGAILVMALIGLSILADPDPGRSMELLSWFVLGLIVLRQLQERNAREDAQQIILSLVLVLASTVQSEKLLFGLIVLVWTVIALYVVILYQLHKGTDLARRRRTECPEGVAHVVPPLSARFGPLELASIRRTVLIALLGLIVFSVAIFVIFPRDILFKSQMPGRGSARQSGFSQNVDLVSSERISESRREVFTLQWKDVDGVPMRWNKPILLRGSVLNHYDPVIDKWAPTPTRRRGFSRSVSPDPNGEFASLGLRPIENPGQEYTIEVTMRSLTCKVVFAPWVPIALATTEGRTFQVDSSNLIIRDSGVDILGSYWSYRLKVQPFPTSSTIRDLIGTPQVRRGSRGFPVPEVRDTALRILQGLGVSHEVQPGETEWGRNRRVSEALMRWLEDNCLYKTDLGDFIHLVGEDPIVSFLERYRFGHCEYFASALTAMCRSLGIQARLVTGYIALEYNEASESYTVRESNAHAWTEVRVGEYDWETMDPSPRSELEAIQVRNSSWADGWRWIYDRLDFLWNSSVVGFDTRTQAMLAKRASGTWEDRLENLLNSALEGVRSVNRFFRLGPAGYIWMTVILALAVSFLFAGIAIVRRRRRVFHIARLGEGDRRKARIMASQLGFWVDALRIMERRGVPKTFSETPLAFSRRASEFDAELGERLAKLAELVYRIRFGDHHPKDDELAEAAALARSLRGGVIGS